jgi:hypothetical protein
MKLMLGLLSVALGFSSAAQAGAYTCAFETNQNIVQQCKIDSASPSTARCSYPFSGTDLSVGCMVVPLGSEDFLSCVIGVAPLPGAAPDLSGVVQSQSAAAAIAALAHLPGFAAAAVTIAPAGKASIHLGYVEKNGSTLFSAICPPTFGK